MLVLAGNDTMYLQVCVCGEAQYVNDTFAVRPHGKATVNPFLTHLTNSFHTIHHRRYHHQIPFLGVLIKRERKQYSSTPEETQTISVPVVSDLTPRLHPHSQTIFFAQREKIVWE